MNLFLQLILTIPPLFVAIVLHEVAHGVAALKLGDPTAEKLGRITLNPIKHIDPMLSIALPLMLIVLGSPVIFGGAKPVPVNPLYFRSPRKDMALVALAGPLTNFILAAISLAIYALLNTTSTPSLIGGLVLSWVYWSIIINIALGLFNLIPIPPLDGGRIMVGILPISLARPYAQLERWGFLILFAALYSGVPQQFLEPVLTSLLRFIGNIS